MLHESLILIGWRLREAGFRGSRRGAYLLCHSYLLQYSYEPCRRDVAISLDGLALGGSSASENHHYCSVTLIVGSASCLRH